MNVHPLFVHFPIAFLSIYAVAELVRIKAFSGLAGWRYAKMAMLAVGVSGAFLALGTGDFGIREFASARAVIGVHEFWAQTTTTIFCILLAFYLIDEAWKKWGVVLVGKPYEAMLSKLVVIIRKIFCAPVVVVLVLAGLIGIIITGALGGAIVYGPNADPAVHLVYSLFF